MLKGMSRRLWVEWQAYAELRPFDQKRADRRAAIVATSIYNSQRTKKSDPVMELRDKMIDYEGEFAEDEEVLDEAATVAWMQGWANAINHPGEG